MNSGIQSIYSNDRAFAALDSDGVNAFTDGTLCDDLNPRTINDVFTNDICQGTLSNLEPTITSVSLTPAIAYSTDSIVCDVSANDPEGDTLTFRYEFHLTANGNSQSTDLTTYENYWNGDNTMSSSTTLIPGDTIHCFDEVYDGYGWSPQVRSGDLIIQNTPPVVSG